MFYFLSKISDTLELQNYHQKLLSQEGRVIKVRIGKPISVKDQKEYKEIAAFSEFIRKKTYMLANPFEKAHKINFYTKLKIQKPAKKLLLKEM